MSSISPASDLRIPSHPAESKWAKESIDEGQDTILLALTGMSPAILTETIWAMATGPEPRIPDRVIVVTTGAGRKQLERLFEPIPDWQGESPWQALRRCLSERGLAVEGRLRFGLTGDDIRIIASADAASGISRELPDIRTPDDNAATADFLLDQVRTLTSNPDLRVVASLAGGRKTMGALLYACMTLAGRETDRLTHVLVNEPFETIPGFWFPGQPGGAVRPRRLAPNESDSAGFDPAQAIVELADVPFVPLRNLFQRELGRAVGAFGRLVETCRTGIRQRAGEHLQLLLQNHRCSFELNTRTIIIPPREYAVLLFIAHQAKQNQPPFLSMKEAVQPLNDFCREHRKTITGLSGTEPRLAEALTRVWSDDQELRRTLSDLRKRLRQQGNDGACLADLLPERGRVALDVPGAQIFIR